MIRIGAVAVNQTPLDFEGNTRRITDAIISAKETGINLLFFPELAISGYGCEDMFLSKYTTDQSFQKLKEIIDISDDITIGIGLPVLINQKTYNAYAMIAHKQIIGLNIKKNLSNTGVNYEKRWFNEWGKDYQTKFFLNNKLIPTGDIVFDVKDINVTLDWGQNLMINSEKAQLIINPAARHFEFFNYQKAIQTAIDNSRNNNCVYLDTNLLGNESGKLVYDGGAFIVENGTLKSSAERFKYTDFQIIWHDTNFTQNTENEINIQEKSVGINNNESKEFLKEEEFSKAISLALFDYIRKARSNGYMISLSGGADSAACLVLCSLMIKTAISDLGFENFKIRLSHITAIQETTSEDEIAAQLISTVYQATANSSLTTLNAAKSLAEECNATFYHIDVDKIVNEYTAIIEEQIGRQLNWETDDLALQNIQARVRAPGVWMLTNIKNLLLITTSNRSELSVGYCTMDGDTAGSIAPLSGINKAWMREWLVWLEKTGLSYQNQLFKYESLFNINVQNPTAELRPGSAVQTDEDDLMPYPILNKIENMFVNQKLSPMECFDHLTKSENGYPKSQIAAWVIKFFNLWSRNQWKRERLAIGFSVDEYNLDPAGWIRYPVLSVSFSNELKKLAEYIDTTSK